MSNNKESSSVEWFKKELEDYGTSERLKIDWKTFDELFEQAKAMHKEEMEHFFKGGMSLVEGRLWKPIDKFEEFYNQKFNSNEQHI